MPEQAQTFKDYPGIIPPFERPITIFPNATNPEPGGSAPLGSVLEDIRGGKYGPQVDSLRLTLKTKGKDVYRERKKSLPAPTFAGVFSYRNNQSLVDHSRVFLADTDHLGANLSKIRTLVEADPHTLFCFESPSQDGLKIGFLFSGAIPDDQTHKLCFDLIKKYCADKFKFGIDESCKDVARLCFVSHDPKLYQNPNATPYLVPKKKPRQKSQVKPFPKIQGHSKGTDRAAQKTLESLCRNIAESKPGDQHLTRRDMAITVGGYIAGGMLDEATARQALEQAVIASGAKDLKASMKTIEDGLQYGMNRPFSAEEKEAERREWAEQNQPAPTGAKTPDEWPDPIPLKSNIPDAPAFPLQCLPHAVGAYVDDIADRIQCQVDYPAISAIISLTGAIGNTVKILPKSRDDWEERACLWTMIIGDPSENKSTPVRLVMGALKEIETELAEDDKRGFEKYERELRAYQLRESAFKDQCKKLLKNDHRADLPAFDVEPPECPKPRRLILVDPSIEKAVDLMAGSRGLTLYRDELSGWLLNMSRYSGGTDRQFYLTCYSGGPWVSDRITREKTETADLYLNIIGTIQPDVARQIFSTSEADGFFERFGLAIYPDPICEWRYVDREPNRQAETAFKMACKKLNDHDFGENPTARYDDEGQTAFIEWYSENRGKILKTNDSAEKRIRGKADGLVNRLALVLHLGAWATGEESNPLSISGKSFLRAEGLYEDYLFPMWRRIMAAFYSDGSEGGADRILKWITEEDIREFSVRDIKRKCWAGLTDGDQVDDAIEVLAENHFISELPKLTKRGRAPKKYAVNPKFKEGI